MDPELAARLQQLEAKIDDVHRRTKSIQNYHRWNLVITFIFLILPLVLSAFALPYLLQTLPGLAGLYSSTGSAGLGTGVPTTLPTNLPTN
jgi:hypothetical protein